MTNKISLIPYLDKKPNIKDSVFIGDFTAIIGDVHIGEKSNIWYNCTLRGDVAPIYIGENTNIQDGTVIHTSRFNGATHIGSNVTVGHKAMIHACNIKDYAFIGMGSIILDNVIVEEYGMVAAGALISPGKVVKSRELWAGIPARIIRVLTDKDIELIEDSAKHYVKLAGHYLNANTKEC